MTIFPLGTNGFFPSFNRQTACYVVPYGKKLIVLDAGSGLFRFAEPVGKRLLNGVENIDLFLSHYHLDHTFGFYAAFELFKGKKVTVYGMKDRKVFKELTKVNLFPVDFDKVFSHFVWKKLDREQKIGDYTVKTRLQYHRGEGSLGFRFEFKDQKTLCYITDSEPNEESIEFVKGSHMLLHEHEMVSREKEKKMKKLEDFISNGHVTTYGAALIARKANVGKLILIHNNPFATDEELESASAFARSIFKESRLAKDGEEIKC